MSVAHRIIPSTDTAAYLLSQGHPVVAVRQLGQGGMVFCFEESPELEEHLLRFVSGRSVVEPRSFVRALNDLRDLARSQVVPA